MTELAKGLQESEKSAIAHATSLLTHYSFDLGNRSVSQLTQYWLRTFPASWIRWAVIEALYQGRYKAISVDQILLLWKRRNYPCYHFNYEFERLVCNKFPRDLRQSLSKSQLPIILEPERPNDPSPDAFGEGAAATQFPNGVPAPLDAPGEPADLLAEAAIEDLQPSIHQFTPPVTPSDFHSKLKAVAENSPEEG